MHLELSQEERILLLDLLRAQAGELKAEINRTETHDFKDELKAREAVLARIVARLAAGAADTER